MKRFVLCAAALLSLSSISSRAQKSPEEKLNMTMYAIMNMYVDTVDKASFVDGMIARAMNELDPFSAYLTPEEVIDIHSAKDYLIYMLGFLPGFSYLGGLDERIHTPRLANPRIRIPAGSVGIGGSQTGIYPLDSPGGWQLLGMTPVKTYDPEREVPILFEAGDYIRFVPVSEEEYQEIKKQVDEGTYQCTIHQKGV